MITVQRYRVGYYTDEWGITFSTPCLLKDDNGYAVKYDDYTALEAENKRLAAQRDELVAALDEIADTACGEASHQYIALKALARVKGQQ